MTEEELNSCRLTSLEEPTDEMLSQIMKEIAEEVRAENAEMHRKFMANLRMEADKRRKERGGKEMKEKGDQPVLIVIAGPNGSGKTTITSKVLHHEWLEDAVYINPDNVAQTKFGGWNDTDSVLKAAQYCEEWREECLMCLCKYYNLMTV